MLNFKRYIAGDRFGKIGPSGRLILDDRAAQALNSIAQEIERIGKLSVMPPLILKDNASGRHVSLELPPEIWAKLGGAGNPYSFTEQAYVPGAGWANAVGGWTGTKAYEANGVSGLAGKVVRLAYERTSDDWRFQFVRLGPKKFTYCFGPTYFCDGSQVHGGVFVFTSLSTGTVYTSPASDGFLASVTNTNVGHDYDPGNPPTVALSGGIGTGGAIACSVFGGAIGTVALTATGSNYTAPVVTASGGTFAAGAVLTARCGVTGLVLGSGGAGYTNGSYTNGTFTGGGGSGATFNYVVAGGVVTSVTLTSAGNNLYTSAPTPVFNAGTPTAVATATSTLSLHSIVATNPGQFYVSPTLTITDSVGAGAGATATTTASTIGLSVFVTAGGTGYDDSNALRPAIVVTNPSTGSGWSGFVNVTVQTCISLPLDSYNMVFTAPGVINGTGFAIVGSTIIGNNGGTISFTSLTPAFINFEGCRVFGTFTYAVTVDIAGSAAPGVTVSFSTADTGPFTCTTDALGHCNLVVTSDANSGGSLIGGASGHSAVTSDLSNCPGSLIVLSYP